MKELGAILCGNSTQLTRIEITNPNSMALGWTHLQKILWKDSFNRMVDSVLNRAIMLNKLNIKSIIKWKLNKVIFPMLIHDSIYYYNEAMLK